MESPSLFPIRAALDVATFGEGNSSSFPAGDAGISGGDGTSIELWFVIPRQTVFPNFPRSAPAGVSVSSPSSAPESGHSGEGVPSDWVSGSRLECSGGGFLVMNPVQTDPRSFPPNPGAAAASSRRLVKPTAMSITRSGPPSSLIGYFCSRAIPWMKPSSNSTGVGDGGATVTSTSPQRPGDRRVLPRLK